MVSIIVTNGEMETNDPFDARDEEKFREGMINAGEVIKSKFQALVPSNETGMTIAQRAGARANAYHAAFKQLLEDDSQHIYYLSPALSDPATDVEKPEPPIHIFGPIYRIVFTQRGGTEKFWLNLSMDLPKQMNAVMPLNKSPVGYLTQTLQQLGKIPAGGGDKREFLLANTLLSRCQ